MTWNIKVLLLQKSVQWSAKHSNVIILVNIYIYLYFYIDIIFICTKVKLSQVPSSTTTAKPRVTTARLECSLLTTQPNYHWWPNHDAAELSETSQATDL